MFAAGYVLSMQWQYYRIADSTVLTMENPSEPVLQRGELYRTVTYNIGFGAYDHDFSFFMDSGTMQHSPPLCKGR